MPDLYLYNGGTQTLDLALSIEDVAARRGALVPPGSQAKIACPDKETHAAMVALHERFGAVDVAFVEDPASFAGVIYSAAPVRIGGAPAPIVVSSSKPHAAVKKRPT